MNRDSHSIFETYKTSSAKQEIIQEGLFDRLVARGAQAVGATKGLGQQAVGRAQQYAGKAVGKVGGALGSKSAEQIGKEITRAGSPKITAGKMAGDVAKYQSIVKSAVANTVNDLKKLKIPVKDEAALTQTLTAAIIAQLTQSTSGGRFRGAGGQLGKKIA